MNAMDHLIDNPSITSQEKGKRKRNKNRYFKILLNELAITPTNYNCKDQNKGLEQHSKEIIESSAIG
jgi:hypothetical protein